METLAEGDSFLEAGEVALAPWDSALVSSEAEGDSTRQWLEEEED